MKTILPLILTYVIVSYAAVPEPPRGRPKSVDCNGPVAFSAVTNDAGKSRTKPINFSNTLLTKATGYSSQSGIFTIPCPGLYQFSFSGAGDHLKLSLRKRPSSATSAWSTIVETGQKGGSQTILLSGETGEDVAIFLDAGTSSSTLSLSFSGFKLAAK